MPGSTPNVHDRAVRLWTHAPVGGFRSPAPAGSAQYFADLRAYRYGYETPFIPRVFGFGRMAGRRVLEVGVGNGIDAVEMARQGAIYTGVDITPRHLELTAAHFAQAGLPAPTLLCGDLPTLLLSGGFDFIYSFGVMHHIPEEARYLRRVRELLAPQGRLLLGVYSRFSFFNTYLCASWLFRHHAHNSLDDWRSHVAERSPLGDPVTIRIRSRREVQRLLRGCGFTVEHYCKRGFVQRYLPVIGRHLQPDGAVLNACGAALGWYHLFECGAAGAQRQAAPAPEY
jgi:SAM-dependent methyltransferase